MFLRSNALIAFLLVGLVSAPAVAQETVSPFSLLHLEPSARAAALGGSFGAVHGSDVAAFFYNPASINPGMDRSLSLTYMNHVGDVNAGFAAYARELPIVGTMAVGLRFLSWGSMERTDESGNEQGTFGASDFVLSIGAAYDYTERVRFGATVHGLVSGMDNHRASALAADVGMLWIAADDRTSVGASLHNAGFVMTSFGQTEDELPLDVRLTVSRRLQHLPLLVSVTGFNLQAPGDAPDDIEGFSAVMRHLGFGAEFQFSDAFNVRFGYNHRRHQDLKMNARLDLAGVGAGFGLKANRFFLDYAYNSWSSLGGLHQFTVRTNV